MIATGFVFNKLIDKLEAVAVRQFYKTYAVSSPGRVMMETKDVNNLIMYYEDERRECLTTQDYLHSFAVSYHCHLENMPLEKKVPVLLSYLRTTHDPTGLGIYQAFKRNDMCLLNDVIYQSACIKQISNISAWGGDHSYFSFHTLPEILASNSVSRISLLVPPKLGLCKNGHRIAKAKMNLIMALWYPDEEFIHEAQKNAEDVLKTKLALSDKASISYLLSLLNEDTAAASQYLNQFCAGKKKSQEYGETKFTRAFCIEAHGLFNLAHYVKNGELENNIKMPEQSNFSQDLAQWQQNNHYPQGSLFLSYPQPLDIVNILLSVTPPVNSLYQPYKNEKGRGKFDWCIDTETYKASVINSVAERYGASE